MEKIKKVRILLKKYNLDGYIVPKNDEFFGEYTEPHKDNLKYISNFSGSYGFALILKKKNYLFVDGRYTQQATIESNKFFSISTIPKELPYIAIPQKKLKLGFDPRIHTQLFLDHFFKKKQWSLIPINKNLIDLVKNKKNNSKIKKFFVLNKKDAGENVKSKIAKLIRDIKINKIDFIFISSPENISWLLNLRGADTEFSPITNGYLILNNKGQINFFCDIRKIDKKIRGILKKINFIDIKKITSFISLIKKKRIQIDDQTCSVFFTNILKKNNQVILKKDPIYLLKSIKNNTEIQNTIKTHISDGVALTKFLFWIKNNYRRKKISEISAQQKLLSLRKKNKKFLSLSFPTISGTGPNASIIHYKASNKSNRILKNGDLYLVDSGGQYKFGTTDVTRTLSLNNKDKKIKDIYTRVLKGHIAVSNFKFSKNTTGQKIDKVARKYLKAINLDYAHGTGHGVGYYLNVHEGPQGISRSNSIKLKPGMILSNEPGYYENGKFGIRIENLIIIKKFNNTKKFVDLTMAPIEKSLINKNLLKENEINWLNNYHSLVYKKLNKFMSKSEKTQLKDYCSNI